MTEKKKEIFWFSTVGWSPMAAINTIWNYCSEFNCFPDKFFFLKNNVPRINENAGLIKDFLNKLNKYYGCNKDPLINFIELKTENIDEYASAAKDKITEQLEKENVEIILDITPGRKYMSMILSNIAFENKDSNKI